MASHYSMDARSYVSARTRDASVAGDNHTVGGGSVACSIAMAQPQPAPYPSFVKICGFLEIYKPSREVLEYDYTYDDVSGKKPPQSYPRIRERGEFYIDSYNGESWSCSFGTAEKVRDDWLCVNCWLLYRFHLLFLTHQFFYYQLLERYLV